MKNKFTTPHSRTTIKLTEYQVKMLLFICQDIKEKESENVILLASAITLEKALSKKSKTFKVGNNDDILLLLKYYSSQFWIKNTRIEEIADLQNKLSYITIKIQ